MEQFGDVPVSEINELVIKEQIEKKGIRSLEISLLPSTKMIRMNDCLPRILSCIMPNLHEINLSHMNLNHYVLANFPAFFVLI